MSTARDLYDSRMYLCFRAEGIDDGSEHPMHCMSENRRIELRKQWKKKERGSMSKRERAVGGGGSEPYFDLRVLCYIGINSHVQGVRLKSSAFSNSCRRLRKAGLVENRIMNGYYGVVLTDKGKEVFDCAIANGRSPRD